MLKRLFGSKNADADTQEALYRKIWLAGLGAYSKGAEEISQLSERGLSLFDELLERGKELESSTVERVSEASTQTKEAFEAQLHSQVQKVTGLEAEQLEELESKIDRLTTLVDKMAEEKAAAKAAPKVTATPKTPPKAAPKAAPKPAAKPAAKTPRRTTNKPA
ncbi:hypothetical protein FCL40_04185 [Ferrimonas sediminicola]|uniref:Poly(Hydroxyalkanoate) granule-associated protein n=1 Tax=Ferrimonas sediminicola TaxID=2569538 RepID=A0A4U1BIH7_9GAMM|nr:phasin family protein [Ferrimonas sediminicola]TKB50359.1 hypothetical protein FCL40_04185 [Ferrimonas sediminicola]